MGGIIFHFRQIGSVGIHGLEGVFQGPGGGSGIIGAAHRRGHGDSVNPSRREPVNVAHVDTADGEGGLGGGMLTTVFGSLAFVLGSFFVVVWATKKARPAGMAPLPTEVIESLGRAPLAGRQQMQLIRLGHKQWSRTPASH